MTITDLIMILAMLAGPLVAIQITRYLDRRKEDRERKVDVFKKLMSTRSYAVSWEHVAALNRIDLEFKANNKKDKAVIDAWKGYLDILNTKGLPLDQWVAKKNDLFVELLYNMAVALDYDFDKVHIKNSSYSPVAHSELESQQSEVRKGMINVLTGKQSIQMHITNMPADINEQ